MSKSAVLSPGLISTLRVEAVLYRAGIGPAYSSTMLPPGSKGFGNFRPVLRTAWISTRFHPIAGPVFRGGVAAVLDLAPGYDPSSLPDGHKHNRPFSNAIPSASLRH